MILNHMKAVREILLVGHRQAFAWIDEWFGMGIQDVRDYETRMQAETNEKVRHRCHDRGDTDLVLGETGRVGAQHPPASGGGGGGLHVQLASQLPGRHAHQS